MPPKKAVAIAASKLKQANGETAATKAKATAPNPKSTTTKARPQPSTTKAPPKTKATSTTITTSKKRRAEDTEDDEPQINGTGAKRAKKDPAPPTTKTITKKPAATTKRGPYQAKEDVEPAVGKKAKTDAKSNAAPKARATKPKPVINTRPSQLLDLYLFGGGEAGELGFAGGKGTIEIKRPRINPYLEADKAGVVQFSVGGMHTAALTHDNKILTWGVNDQGALGRDTTWDGGLKDMKESSGDDDSDDDSEEGEINPHESTPKEVDFSGMNPVPEFTQVQASDSATFALTDEGLVYGWGTFRSNEGIFGFTAEQLVQERPALIPGLKNITKLSTGANHVLALDKAGAVYAWGAGQQNQLGRRILERHQASSLTPAKFGLKGKYTDIGAGSYHSFAIKSTGDVFSWGLNSFGQTGSEVSADGGPDVHLPVKITSLDPSSNNGKVIQITGGNQHSIAVTDTGAALTWGRLDGFQIGIDISTLPASAIKRDEHNQPRILLDPTRIPNLHAVSAAAGSSHSIVLTQDGKAYSFGFNEYGQCGVGHTDDVKVAEHIDNTAVRGKRLVAADCGGQFSCLGSVHVQTNGVNGH